MVSSRTRSVVVDSTTAPSAVGNMVLVPGIGHNKHEYMSPEEAAKHITIWNRDEGRKIAGNAAPLRKNLASYLSKHPECEVYSGQDQELKRSGGIDPRTGKKVVLMNEHIPIWHRLERRKVTGNAAPLKKNLAKYLEKHPECEVYNHQDKFPERADAARERAEKAEREAKAAQEANGENSRRRKGGIPKPGPIAGFANARTVFRDAMMDDEDDDHENERSTVHHHVNGSSNFSKPVCALVAGPNDPSTFGNAMSPMDPTTQNRLDYKGAFGMYRRPDAAYVEPSWQQLSSSWSNTPAWTLMASRSHVAGAGGSTPFSPTAANPRYTSAGSSMMMNEQAPITPSDQHTTALSTMASPRGYLRSPKGDVYMGPSVTSSPGSAPTTPDVPMLGPSGLLSPSMASGMEFSEPGPADMAFSPSNFLISGTGFSMGRM